MAGRLDDAGRPRARRAPAAGRLRAQRALPVPGRSGAPRGPPARADRVGRAFPRVVPAGARRRDGRAGAAAPDVADGREDHDRLGHAHEQGSRGPGGALAVRRPVRADRCRRASRSRSSTRWSSSSIAPSSRSWACRTWGSRSSTRSRIPSGSRARLPRSTWSTLGTLTFEAPDEAAFPCLGLARQAGRAGGAAPAGPERGERGGGRRVPRGAVRLHGGSPADRGRPRRARRRAGGRPGRVPRARRGGAPVDRGRPRRRPGGIGAELMGAHVRRAGRILTLATGGVLLADGSLGSVLLGGALDYVVSALVALGALIFIHELGHFLVAKWMGVGRRAVLARLRASDLLVPARRDRVLRLDRAARRLREDDRRGGPRGGRDPPARPRSPRWTRPSRSRRSPSGPGR